MTTRSDNFVRANETELTGNWGTIATNGCRLISNAVDGDHDSVYVISAWKASVDDFGDDQFSECILNSVSAGDDGGVVVRATAGSGGTCYFLVYETDRIRLYRQVNGVATPIQGTVVGWTNGQRVMLVAEQSGGNVLLKSFIERVQVGSTFTDNVAPITGGQPGLVYRYSNTQGTKIGPWSGGDGSGGSAGNASGAGATASASASSGSAAQVSVKLTGLRLIDRSGQPLTNLTGITVLVFKQVPTSVTADKRAAGLATNGSGILQDIEISDLQSTNTPVWVSWFKDGTPARGNTQKVTPVVS